MQDPNKVKIVDASPETREKLKIYMGKLKLKKCTLNEKKIKTLEDTLLYVLQEAEKVPALTQENAVLKDENEQLKKRIAELEDENNETERR